VVEFTTLTEDFAVGRQIAPEDIAALRAAGFAAILNARPDDETGDYLTAPQAEPLARAAGLDYAHCPTDNHAIFEPDVIAAFETALARLPRPIFAHCKSGTRAAILWALVAARYHPVKTVIETLRAAGQDLAFLEDELADAAEENQGSPLRLKDDPLMALGRSPLMG
jgi:sulfide:quinone oxidoreductase